MNQISESQVKSCTLTQHPIVYSVLNGPILKKTFQFAKASRTEKGAPETPQKNAHHSREKKEREKEAAKKARSELSVLNEQVWPLTLFLSSAGRPGRAQSCSCSSWDN